MILPTIPEGVVWAILLLPVAALVTIGFFSKPFEGAAMVKRIDTALHGGRESKAE